MNKLDLALQLAVKAHAGQTDRDGEAYILHPLQVGLMGDTDEERITGFLHDVLEDTSLTAEELLEAGIPESVVTALQLLTHNPSVSYMEYVQGIIDSNNPIAMKVKLHDLTHNYARGKAYPDLQLKHEMALMLMNKAVDEASRVKLYTPNEGTRWVAFAAGCFWGVQHYLERQKGVLRTLVGYTGCEEVMPNYESVRKHEAPFLEAVLVEYDPTEISYTSLCKLFFEIHNPGQLDGQGPDKGAQYLSGVFYTTDEQHDTTLALVDILRSKGHEVNTRIEPAGRFWIAEAYHQHYYQNTGGSPYCHVRTKKFD